MPFGVIGKILGVLGQSAADKMVEAMLIKLKKLSEEQWPAFNNQFYLIAGAKTFNKSLAFRKALALTRFCVSPCAG